VPVCGQCGSRFPNWLRIDGRARNLSHRKYCLVCSPWGRHDTKQLEKPPAAENLSHLRCSRCTQVKPIEDFYRRRDGRVSHGWCKVCNLEHRKARFRQDRLAALLHYSQGNVHCVCCGERTLEFLALDHVNNDGAAHRRALVGSRTGGTHFYTALRRSGYTYRDLVVMCHNCNSARAYYGRCPHTMM
jgi:hypothetical protein